jgi:hypothetical protein
VNRAEDYVPYFAEKKDRDGNVIETPFICNFNVLFNRILNVDETSFIDGTFNYVKEGSEEKKKEPFTAENKVFSEHKEFRHFFGQYKNLLWYERKHLDDLLSAINLDETRQMSAGMIEVIRKTQHFGWNKDFTAYLTPTWDFVLEMHDDMPETTSDGKYVLVEHGRKYYEKYGSDPENVNFGSVKILNEKIASKFNLGFEIGGETADILTHIKNDLLKLSPIVDRTIPIVFLAPIAIILERV